MKYIYKDSNGKDEIEIETDDDNVVSLVFLGESDETVDYTAEDLQRDLGLYMNHPDATLEKALSAYAGGYGSWRKVEG